MQIEPSNAIHAGEVHASRENPQLSLVIAIGLGVEKERPRLA
jgi:hypothetical protein